MIPLYEDRKSRKQNKQQRAAAFAAGKHIPTSQITQLLSALIEPNDTVLMEGDNQKQATFLAKALTTLDPSAVHDLHLIIPSLQLDEHLELFQKGIASTLDFSYSGNQSKSIVTMIRSGKLAIRSLQTFMELYGRLFIDLSPDICLIAAEAADAEGNLYTGGNTEDTPVLVESTAFREGIVIAQVNEILDSVPRVDIPGSWVDYVVQADEPCLIDPIFTRDPALIKDVHVLMAMMAIKGIYAKHAVKRLNHGIGFNTAAIELLLPTYGEQLGLKGKICTNWMLNPHPTLIPAIESGWVDSVLVPGGELGMEAYTAAHPNIFPLGQDGSLRSNRAYSHMAGQYGLDMFIGATLQMNALGDSSTVTSTRLTGFGGAPNLGSNPNGRRYANESWISMHTKSSPDRGRKCVVQMLQTTSSRGPNFVETLDAVEMGKRVGLAETPIMIYGSDTSHIVTEKGIAYLYLADSVEERKKMVAAVAGDTPIGRSISRDEIDVLRKKGYVAFPEDLGIDPASATRDWLAAKNLEDLVIWSKGLYHIPDKLKK